MRAKSRIAAAFAVIWVIAFLSFFSAAQAASPITLVFANNSGLPDSSVYIGFVGGAGATLSATNAQTGAPLSLSTFASPSWYTLDTLPAGISLSYFSGRIYIGYGAPWTFTHAGYEPNPTSAADPNYLLRFDKMELTYDGNPADVADTTSIDYFSIPLALNAYRGGLSGTLVGSVKGPTSDVVLSALANVTATPEAAFVYSNGDFVRVIGPGIYPPSPGLPASPYDNLSAYLTYIRDSYAPAHSGIVATIKGNFAGVGSAPTTPQTKPQAYNFTATIDSNLDITLSGSGTEIGSHSIVIRFADLTAPSGVYGANPAFYLDGAPSATHPQNDIYGWMIGDLLAGFNIGAVGSTVPASGGGVVGQMDSQTWFQMTSFFSALQPTQPTFYNRWAAAMAPISQAYNFAYSDRFAHVTAPLNSGAPDFVDTLQIVIQPDLLKACTVTFTATETPPGQPAYNLPLTTSICQTNPLTGACINPAVPASSVTVDISKNADVYLSSFVQGQGVPVPYNPAANRIYIVAEQGAIPVGVSSVAVKMEGAGDEAARPSPDATSIVAAVLPYARTTEPGNPVTAFASIVNSGSAAASACMIGLPGGVPAGILYQTTNPSTNLPTGTPNTPADIAAGGTQSFFFSITPTAAFSQEIPLVFSCTNAGAAPVFPGVNTFLLTSNDASMADIVSISVTPSHDGNVVLDSPTGIGAIATAAMNLRGCP